MSDDQTLSFLRTMMKNMNLIIILLISGTVTITTYKIIDAYEALVFADMIEKIPIAPWKVPVISITAYIVLLLLMSIHKNNMDRDIYVAVYILIEVLLCFLMMQALNFNYNTVLLLVIADMFVYWKNTRFRISCMVFLFLLYIITDIAILQNKASVIPLSTYLTYYNVDIRNLLMGIKSVLTSLTTLLFMFYMVLVIRLQRLENERILDLNRRLDDANEQLKIYALNTEKMAETRERNRLAREIHDTLGHSLTGIIAGIDACVKLIDYSTEETKNQLRVIADVTRQGIKDVRRSVKALRPDALEQLSLEEAILQVIDDMSKVTHAHISFINDAGKLDFQEDEEETIYRIIQESITNAIRHGQATQIEISVKRIYNVIQIAVQDNGAGCKEIKTGFGLRHMSERIALLNGTLTYDGKAGFLLIAKIPIRWGEEMRNDKSINCR